jgi:dTDP-4-dehydrorhamnose 3,5-epimerase
MSEISVTNLKLDGLKLLTRNNYSDLRGAFYKIFSSNHLVDAWNFPIKQINLSQTIKKGTVRGMHLQLPPETEAKIVTCLKGAIFDVAIDLRKDSKTFLQWHAEELSEDNLSSLLIPAGFAHGFQTLSDDVEMLYIHSHQYVKDKEFGIHHLDETLKINWPLQITVCSDKDKTLPRLSKKIIEEIKNEM